MKHPPSVRSTATRGRHNAIMFDPSPQRLTDTVTTVLAQKRAVTHDGYTVNN